MFAIEKVDLNRVKITLQEPGRRTQTMTVPESEVGNLSASLLVFSASSAPAQVQVTAAAAPVAKAGGKKSTK